MTTPLTGARNHPIAAAVVGAAIAGLAVLAGCGTGGSGQPLSVVATPVPVPTVPVPGAQTIAMAGSSQLSPLLALWASSYHEQYPQVTLSTTGTASQIIDVARGSAIAALDGYLPPAEATRYRNLRNIPVAVSGIAVVYHVPQLSQAAPVKLNGMLLSRIYAGKIKTWNDPAIRAINRGLPLPATKIVPVRGLDGRALFTAYLAAQDHAARQWPLTSTPSAAGPGQMLSAVSQTPGAIGYVSLSYAGQIAADKLGEAALRNGGHAYVLPQPASIVAAASSFATGMDAGQAQSLIDGSQQAYPIANYEYAIVSGIQPNMATAHDVKAFLYWVLTGGTAQLPEMNLQPLPAAVLTLSQNQIATIRAIVPKPRHKPRQG